MFFITLLFLLISITISIQKTQLLDISITPQNGKIMDIKLLNTKFSPITHLIPRKLQNSNVYYGRILRPLEDDEQINIFEISGNPEVRQKHAIFSTFQNSSEHLTVSSKDYKLKITSSIVDINLIRQLESNGCSCTHGNCACCVDIQIPEFKHSACVNATYNPETVGLDLSIGVDGHYFTQEISIRNPPPVCVSIPIPGAEHLAGFCVAFTDLDLNKQDKILSGCVDLEIELVHLRVVKVKVGCFRMPV